MTAVSWKRAGLARERIEEHGWDGDWYRRAYFDDGSPLGSASNPECQIDSLSQSWSILSGAGTPERARIGMENLDRRLVRRDAGLIQLLDPPFDKSDLNPGYIKGYVPGVRENGGQYTHGAIWTVMAFAAMGDSRRAWELLSLINPVTHAASLSRVSPAIESSHTSSPPTSTPCRPTPVAAAGPGTPAPPDGCTASSPSRSSVCTWK